MVSPRELAAPGPLIMGYEGLIMGYEGLIMGLIMEPTLIIRVCLIMSPIMRANSASV